MCQLQRFFFHHIPAYIIDFFLLLARKGFGLRPIYEKLEAHCDLVIPFTTINYKFHNGNVRKLWEKLGTSDRDLFWFSMKGFYWLNYMNIGVDMGKIYLVKDKPEMLPKGKRRLMVLKIVHYSFIGLIVLLFVYLCFCIIWILICNKSVMVHLIHQMIKAP